MKSLFDNLSAIPYENPDDMDKEMIKSAEAHKNDEEIDLEEYKAGYAEKFILRLPKSLGEELRAQAKAEGVSLNQFILASTAYYMGSMKKLNK